MTDECTSDVNSTRLDAIERDVNELYATVYKGNGHESVVTQLNALNARVDSCNKKIESAIEKADSRWEAKLNSFAEKNQLKIDFLNENINSRLGRIESVMNDRLDNMEMLLKTYSSVDASKSEMTWKSVTIIAGICTVIVSGLVGLVVRLLSE